MAVREYRVGTFYYDSPPDAKPSKVACYTRYFDPTWEGCVVYIVRAESGADAKRIARGLRIKHELESVF